jgi:hypothetical protein
MKQKMEKSGQVSVQKNPSNLNLCFRIEYIATKNTATLNITTQLP